MSSTMMMMMSNVLFVRFAVNSYITSPRTIHVVFIQFLSTLCFVRELELEEKKKFSVMRSNFVCISLIEARQRLIDSTL